MIRVDLRHHRRIDASISLCPSMSPKQGRIRCRVRPCQAQVVEPPLAEKGARRMGQRTNEADIEAVTEVVRTYYDGMMAGDEAKLARAFHPRASIVGNEHGELAWATLDEFVAECKSAVAEAGPHEWRIDGLSFEGDTALVRLGSQYAGVWYSDDLSLLRIDDAW